MDKIELIKTFVAECLTKRGVYRVEAEMAAKCLIEANQLGEPKLGLSTLPEHLENLKSGDIDPRALFTKVHESAGAKVFDANQGLGHVAGSRAVEELIKLAQDSAISFVGVKNSQHFGASSIYTSRLAQAGLLGLVTTSTGTAPLAQIFGATEPNWSRSKLAYSLPVDEASYFLMSSSLTDDDGNCFTQMPMVGLFGEAMAFFTGVLAGPLLGGKAPLHKTRGPQLEQSHHFLMAINPEVLGTTAKYQNQIQQTIADLKTNSETGEYIAPHLIESKTLFGELEIDKELRKMLNAISEELKIPFPEGV